MRVLHILDHSAPLQSGYVSRTLGILRGQRALGMNPVALTTPRHNVDGGEPTEPSEDIADFRFHRTPTPVKKALPGPFFVTEMIATAKRLRAVIDAEKPDVLHAHSPCLNAYPALHAAKSAGLPVVYEIRAFWEDAAVDHGTTTRGSLRYRLTRWMETKACQKADHVFTICDGLRQDLLERGLPAQKLSLAPNAIEPARLSPIETPDADLRRRIGLGDGPVIGFLGSFYHYEGLHLLIEAFPRIREAIPGAQLLFVGGGDEDARLRQAAEAHGSAIFFTGRVPPEAVPAHYGMVDLLVYPRLRTRLTETVTPLKPLEAMAMKRRFIASDVGGHRELVSHGETGRLFAADDPEALAQLAVEALQAVDSEEDRRILDQGYAFVNAERSWSAVAQRYAPVYERLMARG
jgi:PEP-CTERM/exosortase A-associated glycosyltransferase